MSIRTCVISLNVFFSFFLFFFFFVWKASRFVSNDLLQRNNMLLILAIKQDRWPPLYITSLYVVCCICIQTSTRTSITDELSNIFDPAELTDSTKKKKRRNKEKKVRLFCVHTVSKRIRIAYLDKRCVSCCGYLFFPTHSSIYIFYTEGGPPFFFFSLFRFPFSRDINTPLAPLHFVSFL